LGEIRRKERDCRKQSPTNIKLCNCVLSTDNLNDCSNDEHRCKETERNKETNT